MNLSLSRYYTYFHVRPHVRLLVGRLVVGLSVLKWREVTVPCSYRSTCLLSEKQNTFTHRQEEELIVFEELLTAFLIRTLVDICFL